MKKPAPLPPPPEALSPAMQAWADQVRSRHADLAAAYRHMWDASIDAEKARARGSNQPPDDMKPLKSAARIAGVEGEWARRLHQAGLVVSEQAGKGTKIRISVSSLLQAARERLW
jgi:hypothetical protein